MLSLRRILFPTDGSSCADHAFAQAAFFAHRFAAELHVVHVASPIPDGSPVLDTHEALAARAQGVVGAAFRGRIVRAEVRAVEPALGLLEYMQQHEIDLVVMGTHGRRGVGRLMLGSVTEDVVRLADQPVLTVRPGLDASTRETPRLLVPVDFSPSSWLAVAYAQHLASTMGGALDLLHVVETLPNYGLVDIPAAFPPPSDEVIAATRTALLDLAKEAGGPTVPVMPHVVAGHPVLGLLETAKALTPDLIVMPSHGRTGLRRMVLGSVAEQIVRQAPSPVLVVRGDDAGIRPDDEAQEEEETTSLAASTQRLSPPIQRAHPTPRRYLA